MSTLVDHTGHARDVELLLICHFGPGMWRLKITDKMSGYEKVNEEQSGEGVGDEVKKSALMK